MIAEKIEKIKNNHSTKHEAASKNPARPEYSFKMLVVIVEHGRAEEIVETLAELGIIFHVVCMGEGTADSAILQLLNLDQSDKDVIINVVERDKVDSALKTLRDKFEGSGIAFTVKLASIGGMKALRILQGDLSVLRADADKKE